MTVTNDVAAAVSSSDQCNSAPAPSLRPWLQVVGLGEDGIDGLSPNARRAIASANYVFGGKRHLQLVAEAITGEALPWPTPFDPGMAMVLAHRGEAVCVLASGDPMHFGVGATLARLISPGEMRVWSAPSAFSLAAARLGWALQDVTLLSLHGRDEAGLRAQLFPGQQLLALTSDGDAPLRLARMLVESGFGASKLHVLEALGGPREQISAFCAADYPDGHSYDPLNLVGVELCAAPEARPAPLGCGLDDSFFAHDGQITKRHIRAITLAALAPLPGHLLWDLGAGSGSISIEWLRLSPTMRAIALERDAVRAERARDNAARLGVPRLDVRTTTAQQALDSLPAPDAVFIGGGASDALAEAACAALRPGGRLVINAVTLQTQALLTTLQQRHGGALTALSVAHTVAVGTMSAWRPAMPIVQWSWRKPTSGQDISGKDHVAGVGCNASASASDIEAAVRAALAANALDPSALACLATTAARAALPAFATAAAAMDLPLIIATPEDLAGASSRCLTHSDASMRATNLPSVSEAAALAVAGANARLLARRTVLGPATCAIAFGQNQTHLNQDPT